MHADLCFSYMTFVLHEGDKVLNISMLRCAYSADHLTEEF